ncbi:MAG: hypothetical protein WA742_04515 [Candidatus Cybelea sp.]
MIDLGARLDRNDRHVRRIRLSLHHAAARARIEFALSETLRLMTLPGEDQGRVYYVRRVNVKDVAADGNRAIWLDKMQSAFSALADRAMHGNDRRAVASDVVFFHSHDEALELLLGRIVKREPFAEWFWPLVSSCELDSSRGEQIAAIVERLRELPGSWARVAQVLFALHDDGGTIDVVAALPLANVARWLRELGAERADDTFAPNLTLPENVECVVARAARRFGRDDPRAVWLASLAVLRILPPRPGVSVAAYARATLRRIEASQALTGAAEPSLGSRDTSAAIVFDEATSIDEPRGPIDPLAITPQPLDARAFDERKRYDARFDRLINSLSYLGARTDAAGLYFLLNPMARLGVASAAADPRFAQARVAARVLMHLAAHAGVEPSDPILAWMNDEIEPSNEAFASLGLEAPYAVRAWALAVRRWCWRAGRLSVREIVNRNGRVVSSRTDVDVSFALDQADVRIRRLGLDIDPGWLPWFGCVVRFHYVRDFR